MSDGATYRESARTGRTEPLRGPCLHRALRSAAVLGSVAVSGVAGAAIAGSVELAVLAGAGAVAAAAHCVRAAGQRRRHRAIARFLASDVVIEEPGTWTTPDGRRRVRVKSGDEQARFERLDPVTGETLESFRGPSPAAPPPRDDAVIVEHVVATVHGRPIDPRCFTGLPPQLGGRFARLEEVRLVAMDVRRDGVLVERLDGDGQLVGDTWHADLAAALTQLDGEYGGHLGRWRDPDVEPSDPSDERAASWDVPLRSHLGL